MVPYFQDDLSLLHNCILRNIREIQYQSKIRTKRIRKRNIIEEEQVKALKARSEKKGSKAATATRKGRKNFYKYQFDSHENLLLGLS